MGEATDANHDQPAEQESQNVSFGSREKLLQYLQREPLAITGIGLEQWDIEGVPSIFELITTGELEEVKTGGEELAKAAAAILTDKSCAEEADRLGIDVVFDGYDIQDAVADAASVIRLLGGEISPEEEVALARAVLPIPFLALQDRYGKVYFNERDGEIDFFGIAITDRNPYQEATPGSYSLEEKKISVKSSDQFWRRKIAHEIVHALRYARSGINHPPDEAFATLVEYIVQLPGDQRKLKLESLKRTNFSDEIEVLKAKAFLMVAATASHASSVLKVFEESQRSGVNIEQQFAEFIK